MPRPPNAHRPLAEPLLAVPGAHLRHMFGGEAIYVQGVLLLVLADGEPPWNGLLLPTEREQHPGILAEFPFLAPHAVLPKWLFLNAEDEHFEARADPILRCLLAHDPRFGVVPVPRKRKAKQRGSASPAPSDGRPPHLR